MTDSSDLNVDSLISRLLEARNSSAERRVQMTGGGGSRVMFEISRDLSSAADPVGVGSSSEDLR
ncbi:Serine/threonine-protein phosphatase beta isoform [Orchesella cincta]|uniref:Serine/threonine-protein phosphatase beta isoform n=1 Tax=Orchesella cincta TaxID=48709 RepID=A0A1D2M5T6_ORCCI|nr:Serine/threonine-protein phosphatase beta isoform [Orchesella cincta]